MFQSAENHTFGTRVREVGASVAFMFIWVLFFSLCLQPFLSEISGTIPKNELVLGVIPNYVLHDYWRMGVQEAIASGLGWRLVAACIIAPFIEEIIFRGAVCLLAADDKGKLRHWGVMLILALSCIGFGMAHRNGLINSIMIQGVVGLFLARLWFKNGPGQKASYFSCVAAHSLYNFCIIAGALTL